MLFIGEKEIKILLHHSIKELNHLLSMLARDRMRRGYSDNALIKRLDIPLITTPCQDWRIMDAGSAIDSLPYRKISIDSLEQNNFITTLVECIANSREGDGHE